MVAEAPLCGEGCMECSTAMSALSRFHSLSCKIPEEKYDGFVETVLEAMRHMRACRQCRTVFRVAFCEVVYNHYPTEPDILAESSRFYNMHKNLHLMLRILPFVDKEHYGGTPPMYYE